MSQQTRPLISIVIPCHNQHRYIGDALQSARNQSYPFVEIIAVDSDSTDGSGERMASFGSSVKIVRSDRRLAVGAARNLGFAHSSGAFVQFLDGDDVLLPEAIGDRYRVFAGHPDTDLVYGIQRWLRSEQFNQPRYRYKHAICDGETALFKFYEGLDRRKTIAQSSKRVCRPAVFYSGAKPYPATVPSTPSWRTTRTTRSRSVMRCRERSCGSVPW
jgi:glycosyltransferase involved in cell wall biosynthesis